MSNAMQRTLEIAVCIVALIVLAPLVLLLGLVLTVDLRRSPWFVQDRVGLNGRTFKIYKLRTLAVDQVVFDRLDEIFPGDDRLTWFGSFVRRHKLDEIPQFINVLKGDMALVGPRPDLPQQAADYSDADRARLRCKPGMTGITQISGNTTIPWEKRVALDSWYENNRSFELDVAILLRTPVSILASQSKATDPLDIRKSLGLDAMPESHTSRD